ncbi:hypothetical protein [Methanolobus halotolerans]|uniref:Uncharacterized protein n=1 Tax=Methanolobus halotolerans TaxID=2052935 RepID=A0A4E0Q792_9EURY|nr:hypothetical protein [Methanolobus halotolerans]TGC10673.1 hypothetical protein CUN85_04130 [Methanolobus halotolerans]
MKKKTMAVIGLILLFLLFSGGDDGATYDVSRDEWTSMIANGYDDDKAASMSVYESLAFQGIDDANVQVTPERVFVKYDQPPVKSDSDALLAWFYIMGVAAGEAPGTDEIIIQMYAQNNPLFEVSVPTGDVLDFLESRITLDEFRTKVDVKAIM